MRVKNLKLLIYFLVLFCSVIVGVYGDIKYNSMWLKVKIFFELFVFDVRIRYDCKIMKFIYGKEVFVYMLFEYNRFFG